MVIPTFYELNAAKLLDAGAHFARRNGTSNRSATFSNSSNDMFSSLPSFSSVVLPEQVSAMTSIDVLSSVASHLSPHFSIASSHQDYQGTDLQDFSFLDFDVVTEIVEQSSSAATHQVSINNDPQEGVSSSSGTTGRAGNRSKGKGKAAATAKSNSTRAKKRQSTVTASSSSSNNNSKRKRTTRSSKN